jgi:hypothetical protein
MGPKELTTKLKRKLRPPPPPPEPTDWQIAGGWSGLRSQRPKGRHLSEKEFAELQEEPVSEAQREGLRAELAIREQQDQRRREANG